MCWRVNSQNFVEIGAFSAIKTSKGLTRIACRRGLLRRVCCFLMPWGRLSTDDKLRHPKYESRTLTLILCYWALPPIILDVWLCLATGHVDKNESTSPYVASRVKLAGRVGCSQRHEKSWQDALFCTAPQLAQRIQLSLRIAVLGWEPFMILPPKPCEKILWNQS